MEIIQLTLYYRAVRERDKLRSIGHFVIFDGLERSIPPETTEKQQRQT
jgi:hypothetical protein